MGGFGTRMVTAGGSFSTIGGGECYMHYEIAEWDIASRMETVSCDWENVTFTGGPPDASNIDHRADPNGQHEDAFRILSPKAGTKDEPNDDAFLVVSGSVTDDFGTNTASGHFIVSFE